MDKSLKGLAPRYIDWPWCDPLHVDADLLPGFVPGYQPPFKILPYSVKATHASREAANLRRRKVYNTGSGWSTQVHELFSLLFSLQLAYLEFR